MAEGKVIICNRKNDKWLCDIDGGEKEVVRIHTSQTNLFDPYFIMYVKPDEKCGFMLNKHGDKELICANSTQIEYIKEMYRLKEEID